MVIAALVLALVSFILACALVISLVQTIKTVSKLNDILLNFESSTGPLVDELKKSAVLAHGDLKRVSSVIDASDAVGEALGSYTKLAKSVVNEPKITVRSFSSGASKAMEVFKSRNKKNSRKRKSLMKRDSIV